MDTTPTKCSGHCSCMARGACAFRRPCTVCGIPARWLSIAKAWVHTEPRTLANNLHNGTPDHNARV